MNPLSFLLGRLIVGRLRVMRKHPSQIVFLVILVLFLSVVLFAASRDTDRTIGWVDEPTRGAILTLICGVFAYVSVRTGLKQGSTFYRLADVNIVFPSPVSRRRVLLYGFARQLGISALILLWLVFQTTNLQWVFGITGYGFVPFVVGAFLIVCYQPVVSMLIYGRLARHPSHRVWWVRGANLVVFAVAVLFTAMVVRTADPMQAFRTVFNHQIVRYIPVIGWVRTLLCASYLGWDTYVWVSLALSVSGLLMLVWYMLRVDLDFYEDVLLVTEKRETAIKRKKEGRSPFQTDTQKSRKAASYYRGYGPSALFYRHLLEYRKVGFFLFDRSTLIVILFAVVAAYFLRDVQAGMYYLLYVSLYLLFLLSIEGKWDQELRRPFIFLMPGRPLAKIWHATTAVHLKHLADGLILFMIAGWYFGVPIVLRVLFALCYVGFGGLYLYTTILFYRWIGRLSETTVMRIVVFMLILAVSTPALTLLVYSNIRYPANLYMQQLFLSGVVLYSMVIAFMSMVLGRRLFTDMDHTAL